MPRNFEGRYEIMFPVEGARAKEFILRELRSQLRDDVNAYELKADGSEVARWGGTHDSQRLGGERHTAPGELQPAPEPEHGHEPEPEPRRAAREG